MSKIPGVSEHLFNHINKRMTSILNRCKIPVFNIEDYVFNKKVGEGAFGVIFSVFKKEIMFLIKKLVKELLVLFFQSLKKMTKNKSNSH